MDAELKNRLYIVKVANSPFSQQIYAAKWDVVESCLVFTDIDGNEIQFLRENVISWE